MVIKVSEDKCTLARVAAEHATRSLRDAIRKHGRARLIAATGAAQFEFLEALTSTPNFDWARVEMFHLDEYIGLPSTHPASFSKYLLDRLIHKTGITHYHLLGSEGDPAELIRRVSGELQSAPANIAFVGIGENGHLAFNDPPADFQNEEAFIVVDLDEPCRRQQVGEGWFADLSEVPKQAISMTVRQVLKTEEIIVIVPDARKAKAVKSCLEGEISPMAPASILRTHPNTTVYLDKLSAALLSSEVRASA